MESNANQVFNTYELLENIMRNLSMTDLYALQSLNHTFRNITLHSEAIKATMGFRQHVDETPGQCPPMSAHLWLKDQCHGVRLCDRSSGPEACINPIILHLCKRMEILVLVLFEGPLFRVSEKSPGDPELILCEKYCKLKLYASSESCIARGLALKRLLKGSCGGFLMRSWMTNLPMDVECSMIGTGGPRFERLTFQAVIGRHGATVGTFLSVLLEYFDTVRADLGESKA